MLPALINLSFILFCPESPRWLYTTGQATLARKVLAQLHSSTSDPNSPLVDMEMEEIKEALQFSSPDGDCHFYVLLVRMLK